MEQKDLTYNIIENIVIMSIRKETYVLSILTTLEGKSMDYNLAEKIKLIIANMDPVLFISDKEAKCGHLITNTNLEELDRSKIAEELGKNLNF